MLAPLSRQDLIQQAAALGWMYLHASRTGRLARAWPLYQAGSGFDGAGHGAREGSEGYGSADGANRFDAAAEAEGSEPRHRSERPIMSGLTLQRNMRALAISIGFWGTLYLNYNQEP